MVCHWAVQREQNKDQRHGTPFKEGKRRTKHIVPPSTSTRKKIRRRWYHGPCTTISQTRGPGAGGGAHTRTGPGRRPPVAALAPKAPYSLRPRPHSSIAATATITTMGAVAASCLAPCSMGPTPHTPRAHQGPRVHKGPCGTFQSSGHGDTFHVLPAPLVPQPESGALGAWKLSSSV